MARKKTNPADLQAPLATAEAPFGATLLASAASLTATPRTAARNYMSGGFTPRRLAKLLSDTANLQNTDELFELAEEIEEKDSQFRSVINTRKLALSGLKWKVESASDSPADLAVAQATRDMLTKVNPCGLAYELADAISKGVAVAEINWIPSASSWLPAVEARPQHWFRYDPTDGKTLRLKPGKAGGQLIDLPAHKFIIHQPQLKSGLPIRAGLIRPAAWLWLMKAITQKDWLAFVELFGQPLRIGKYTPGTPVSDINVLKRAVESLGTDAAAVFPESMRIEFIEQAGKTGSADLYERVQRYADEQCAKLVLGQTNTTEAGGGSLAKAKVQDGVRHDLLKADVAALNATFNAQLVTPYVAFNYGENVKLPLFSFIVDEPEDIAGLVNAVEKLTPMGLRVEASVMRDKLGLPDPAEGAEVLVAPAQPAPAQPLAALNSAQQGIGFFTNTACPEHGLHAAANPKKDALDDVVADLQSAFAEAAQMAFAESDALTQARSVEEFQAALIDWVQDADVSRLQELMAMANVKAFVAGKSNGEI